MARQLLAFTRVIAASHALSSPPVPSNWNYLRRDPIPLLSVFQFPNHGKFLEDDQHRNRAQASLYPFDLNLCIGPSNIWSSGLQVAPLEPHIDYWTFVAVLAAGMVDIATVKQCVCCCRVYSATGGDFLTVSLRLSMSVSA